MKPEDYADITRLLVAGVSASICVARHLSILAAFFTAIVLYFGITLILSLIALAIAARMEK